MEGLTYILQRVYNPHMPDHARYVKDKEYYTRYNNSPERKAHLREHWKVWAEKNKMWRKPAQAARDRERLLRRRAEKAKTIVPEPKRKPLTEEELLQLRQQIYGLAKVLKREESNPGSARMRRRKRRERVANSGKSGK